jgi:hypothetical protein
MMAAVTETRRGPGGAKAVRLAGRNVVFDAIVKAVGYPDAMSVEEARQVGAAEKVIRGLAWAEEEEVVALADQANPAGAPIRQELLSTLHAKGSRQQEALLYREVNRRAESFRRWWPDARLSPTDLAANWTRLR